MPNENSGVDPACSDFHFDMRHISILALMLHDVAKNFNFLPCPDSGCRDVANATLNQFAPQLWSWKIECVSMRRQHQLFMLP